MGWGGVGGEVQAAWRWVVAPPSGVVCRRGGAFARATPPTKHAAFALPTRCLADWRPWGRWLANWVRACTACTAAAAAVSADLAMSLNQPFAANQITAGSGSFGWVNSPQVGAGAGAGGLP